MRYTLVRTTTTTRFLLLSPLSPPSPPHTHKSAEEGLFRAYSGAGGPTEAGSSAFLGWEAGLSAAGDLVGFSGLVRVIRLMCIMPSTLLIPLLLLLYSFVGASSLLRMFLRVFGVGVSLSLGGLGYWEAGCRYGPCGPISIP